MSVGWMSEVARWQKGWRAQVCAREEQYPSLRGESRAGQAEPGWWRSSQELQQWQVLHRPAGRRRWWGLQRQRGGSCHGFCFLIVTLETWGTRRDWSTCGRGILRGTPGKICKFFIQNLSTAPAKKPGCDLHGLRKQKKRRWGKLGVFLPSFCDAICKCLKPKEMFCSHLTWGWALQRCLCVAGTISPSDLRVKAEAPWHRGCCWGLLPIALKWLGKARRVCLALLVAAWGIWGLRVAPFQIWRNKCNDLKHLSGQEPKGEKDKGLS